MRKSAPAVMRWASGVLNLATPLTPGNLLLAAFSAVSYLALPVPRMATWRHAERSAEGSREWHNKQLQYPRIQHKT